MAGHSQFKNIMHRKGAQDAKRAKIFTRLGREIEVAARQGQPDPAANPRLRAAIAAARNANMPKERIERAIKRAASAGDGVDYVEVRYEGYGPGGVAMIVEALTDNRNRTAADVRAAFNKAGGSLGETNSVAFMFDRVGEIVYEDSDLDAEAVLEAAIEAGAQDVSSSDGNHEVLTAPDDLHQVCDALEECLGPPTAARLAWRAQNSVPVSEEPAQSLFKLLETLDDHDDVQTVAANFEVSDDVLTRLAS